MPVARGTRWNARSVIVLGLTAVAVAILLGAMALYIADNGNNVRLGDNQFGDLQAERTARRIEREGPIQFPDVSGGSRVVNLSHVGNDPKTGWFVFDARSPGAARECLLDWNRERKVFVDRCDANNTYPIDGKGLRQYVVSVNERGQVVVDFNADPATTTTTAATATTTTR
jgi:hypothetical protein